MNTETRIRLFSKRWFTLGAATLLMAGLILAACGGGTLSGGRTGDTAATAQGAGERLWIKDHGQTVPFQNGASITVGGTNIEIYVSPYPPGRTANMDFYLTRDGIPVEGAAVTLQYDMTVMEHGPFRLLAAPVGRGHFLAPLEFAMSGDFWLNVAVDAGDGGSVINMYVRAVR